MGAYSRVKRRIWHDEAVQNLSPTAKLLFMYLLTCPHGNALGCFVLKRGYATDDIGIDAETFGRDFAELQQRGLVAYDPETHLLLIPNYLKHNPITHRNQATGAIKRLDELPTSPLLAKLLEAVESAGKDYLKDLAEAIRQRLPKDMPKDFDHAFGQHPDTGSPDPDEGSPPGDRPPQDGESRPKRRARRGKDIALEVLREKADLDRPAPLPHQQDLQDVVAVYHEQFPQPDGTSKERLSQITQWAYQDFGALLAQNVPKQHIVMAIRASPPGSMPRDCVRTYQRMYQRGQFSAPDEYEDIASRIGNLNFRKKEDAPF